MKRFSAIFFLFLLMLSCGKLKDKTKDAINKGGETVGKGATEFIEGVSEGVDRSLDCQVVLSPDLISQGIKTGKYAINNDSTGGKNNLFTLYIIFDKNFKKEIRVKAFDKKGLELGRTKLQVEGKAGEAKYFDFLFDKRTCIEVKSKLILE